MVMRQVVLYPDLEDGGWIAEVPSLPGCVSQGETKEETLRNIQDAIETWIEGAEAVGQVVPQERFDVQVCVVPN
jgi:predicted RNase H-like HicB family nuclease